MREIAGWLLVGLGLVTFYWSFLFLGTGHFVEGGELSLIGIIVFRGGIHLLKVAVAARVCLQAQPPRPQERTPIAGTVPAGHRPGRAAARYRP
jgi:hypothetical protein